MSMISMKTKLKTIMMKHDLRVAIVMYTLLANTLHLYEITDDNIHSHDADAQFAQPAHAQSREQSIDASTHPI